jgi:hypothetical protein
MPLTAPPKYRLRYLALLLIALSACSAQDNILSATQPTFASSSTLDSGSRASYPLYVSNLNDPSKSDASVSVLTANGKRALNTISLGSGIDVSGMTADSNGHLYVATGAGRHFELTVYSDQGAKLAQTIKRNFPLASLTLDKSGNLWASCAIYRVCMYASDAKKVLASKVSRQIDLGQYRLSPGFVAIDRSGNLAVGDKYNAYVFAPYSSAPFWKIATGGTQTSIAFDLQGNLYIASYVEQSGAGTISVYSSGSSSPSRSISIKDAWNITSMQFDASGNLYALNPACTGCGPVTVSVIPPGESSVSRMLQKGMGSFGEFVEMTVSEKGSVYVSGFGSDSVPGGLVMYDPGKNAPHAITQAIVNPYYLATGDPTGL